LKNKTQVILLDGLCQRYGKRPSEVFGIEDELTAIDFDFTVMIIGNRNEKERIESKEETIETAKQKQSEGFEQVKMMQNLVKNSYKRNQEIPLEE